MNIGLFPNSGCKTGRNILHGHRAVEIPIGY